MAEFVPVRAAHLTAIRLQPMQACLAEMIDDDYASAVEAAGGVTMLDGGGRVLACGGVLPVWRGRGLAWTLIAEGLPVPLWTAAARRMAAEIAAAHDRGMRRIEATVRVDFRQGHRLAGLMGMHREGRMQAYDPWGHDHDLYARVI